MNTKDIATAVLAGLIACLVWYHVYVKRADEARYEIMECMGDDSSRASYDSCISGSSAGDK